MVDLTRPTELMCARRIFVETSDEAWEPVMARPPKYHAMNHACLLCMISPVARSRRVLGRVHGVQDPPHSTYNARCRPYAAQRFSVIFLNLAGWIGGSAAASRTLKCLECVLRSMIGKPGMLVQRTKPRRQFCECLKMA